MRFEILGPVRAWLGGTRLDIGPPTQQSLLTLLLVNAGDPVTLTGIVDALWGENPPRTAVNIVHRHVGALRRLTDPELPPRATGSLLLPSSGGYRMDVDADMLDLLEFRRLRDRAQYAEALALWRGPIATGIPEHVRSRPEFVAVTHEYLAAVRDGADAAPSAGTPEQVLAAVQRAAADHPLDESIQARLIRLLTAAGNEEKAKHTYETVREQLVEELGVDPGPELRSAVAGGRRRAVPAQLPADLPTFTGRAAELTKSLGLLDTDRTAMTTVAISGMAGVGKTTLAVRLAHQVAHYFPDGRLYVHLHGFSPGAAPSTPDQSASEAVGGLLETLGVPPSRIPADLDARTALYRSMLAGRRVLVLIDDARDAEHALPLLPGAPGCMVIVTSRNQLLSLVARCGAHPITLGLPTAAEARDLLAHHLGPDRVANEPGAVEEIIARCGRLPLALAIVAARATTTPDLSLTDIVAELRASSLDADVRMVFSWSYRAVSTEAARLYRLLGLHPGPHVFPSAAASLAGLQIHETRALLEELAHVHLITERLPDEFTFHDLLRAHAAELAEADDEAPAARARLADHYLYSAYAAAGLLFPYRYRAQLPPIPPGVILTDLGNNQKAEAWLRSERAAMLAVAAQVAQDCQVWQLAAALELFLDRQGRWQQQCTLQRLALAAAERKDDKHGRANAHRALGFAYGRLGRFGEAEAHLDQALALFSELGDLDGQGVTRRNMAFQANRTADHDLALTHYDRVLELYTASGNESGVATVHNEIGWTCILLGKYDEALTECELAVRMQERLGNRSGQASAADSVGYAYHHLGKNSDAIAWYEISLRLYRDINDRSLVADTLSHIGDAYDALGDRDAAKRAWGEALEILDELNHPDAGSLREKLG
jgi:DNA-binding SARP family transcriptional activator/tetratricopeptide (TPR) repeat protein